ncbi:MAG TPA: carboxypeptidase-like regulatory domain-containing protein, partial [Gemmatimonadales bacterium]|nr:carboxypeptidase-like regulatory domain-containing protein [Gemmatimonadales bacterium]
MFTPPIRPFLALVALLAAPSLTYSGPTGRIGGHVRDASGAPIAHAQVFVVGTSLGAVTNVTGAYSIDSVPVGTYTVRAQFIGYTPAVLPNIQVRAGQAVAVDIVLQPATMN